MIVDLPYPHKALWPNGRAHYMEEARQTARHRAWADVATLTSPLASRQAVEQCPVPIPVKIYVHAKKTGPLPDRDNASAAAKSFLDGISQRLGINDRDFAAPIVEFAMPRDGRFVIVIGNAILESLK